MEFLELIKDRYSVRSFKNERITDEELNKILEAGRIAPTAKNYQPIKIVVVENDEGLNKLNSQCKCIYGAKTVLIVCYNKNECWINKRRGDYNTGEVDATIVSTYMALEAHSLGIGSVFVGMFSDEEIKKSFDLDNNLVPTLLIPLGYPSDDSAPLEGFHDVRKNINDLVIKK